MKTVIYGMLQEEKQRNLDMQKSYSSEISSLPKGSITNKYIYGNTYSYLTYRQNGKVKTDYMGKDEAYIEDLRQKIKKREHLKGVLKRLRAEYKQICKIVKD